MSTAGLVELVRASIERFGSETEKAVFSTTDPDELAEVLIHHAGSHVAAVDRATFYRVGVGVVVGLRLVDGRSVVVKAHRWNASIARLGEVQRVQSHLADQGLPAPRPLDRPRPLGRGCATVEEQIDADDADGHRTEVRQSVASTLHRFVDASRSLGEVGVGSPAVITAPDEPLWPEPHDVRFDFDATSDGAEWIDAAAQEARTTLHTVDAEDRVVGHFDWRTENLGFAGHEVSAIYDWDSVASADEAVVVGSAAAQFCANWRRGHPVPSPEEIRRFVDDYQRARGRGFTEDEARRVDAATTALVAYGARCQHSDRRLRPDLAAVHDHGWIDLLRALTGA
ncbi:MAG: hypothetical protein AAGF91_14470 [Actinomycetota bacterium]